MLLNLREYHRPAAEVPSRALDHALDLLARPGICTVPLAGGDTLLACADPDIEAVVDLQGLGLDAIAFSDDTATLRIGAMVTRAALADDARARSLCSGLLAESARHWGGNVQRQRGTIGGAIATAAPDDPLVTALLACDAYLVLKTRTGTKEMALSEFLPRRTEILRSPALITEITVFATTESGGGALATVARTPADAPIVMAAATVRLAEGKCTSVRLALGGVAEGPLDLSHITMPLIGEPLTDASIVTLAARVSALVNPAGDFRGSASYRKAMAGVMAERALREARQRAA